MLCGTIAVPPARNTSKARLASPVTSSTAIALLRVTRANACRIQSGPIRNQGPWKERSLSSLTSGLQRDAEARRERLRQPIETMADADHRKTGEVDNGAGQAIFMGIFRLPVVEMNGGGLAHRRLDILIIVFAAGQRKIGGRSENGGAASDRA